MQYSSAMARPESKSTTRVVINLKNAWCQEVGKRCPKQKELWSLNESDMPGQYYLLLE